MTNVRTIVTLAISALLSACAGVFVTFPEISNPSVQQSQISGHKNIKKEDVANERKSSKVAPVVSQSGNEDIWTYSYSNDWCGVFFIVIPLMLPVCDQYDAYHFQGDELVKHDHKSTKTKGFMCSLLWSPCEGCGICGPVH